MLNPLKKTKNAWSLIFFNAQVLSASGLLYFYIKAFSFYNLFEFELKNFLKLVFKNEM